MVVRPHHTHLIGGIQDAAVPFSVNPEPTFIGTRVIGHGVRPDAGRSACGGKLADSLIAPTQMFRTTLYCVAE